MPTSTAISNLTPARVRRCGNGCGDGRTGGRDGGGVRRIYHLSSRLTVFPFSAGLCACLRIALRIRCGCIVPSAVVGLRLPTCAGQYSLAERARRPLRVGVAREVDAQRQPVGEQPLDALLAAADPAGERRQAQDRPVACLPESATRHADHVPSARSRPARPRQSVTRHPHHVASTSSHAPFGHYAQSPPPPAVAVVRATHRRVTARSRHHRPHCRCRRHRHQPSITTTSSDQSSCSCCSHTSTCCCPLTHTPHSAPGP